MPVPRTGLYMVSQPQPMSETGLALSASWVSYGGEVAFCWMFKVLFVLGPAFSMPVCGYVLVLVCLHLESQQGPSVNHHSKQECNPLIS